MIICWELRTNLSHLLAIIRTYQISLYLGTSVVTWYKKYDQELT